MTYNKMVKLLIDGREIRAEEGKCLLETCLDNDIYVPNLCHVEGMENPHASCRLCFVEIGGEEKPVSSCTLRVRDGMVVRTDTPPVRRLQRAAFEFLLSTHDVQCKGCPANKKCELQRIAKFLKAGLKSKLMEQHFKDAETDPGHPIFNYYPNRCVLCGKCIYACREKHGHALLTFAKRGIDTVISFYGEEDMARLPGKDCLACVEICPVSAITLKADA